MKSKILGSKLPLNKEECRHEYQTHISFGQPWEDCIHCGLLKSTIEANSKPTELRCECDDLIYLSNPPQNKCKHCGNFWFCKDPAPICGRTKPTELERADDLIGHNVSGLDSVSMKDTELSELLEEFDKFLKDYEIKITSIFQNQEDIMLVKSFLTKICTTALAKGRAGERLSKKKIIGEILELRNKNPYHSPENRSIYDFAFEDILKLSSLSDISSGLGGGE